MRTSSFNSSIHVSISSSGNPFQGCDVRGASRRLSLSCETMTVHFPLTGRPPVRTIMKGERFFWSEAIPFAYCAMAINVPRNEPTLFD